MAMPQTQQGAGAAQEETPADGLLGLLTTRHKVIDQAAIAAAAAAAASRTPAGTDAAAAAAAIGQPGSMSAASATVTRTPSATAAAQQQLAAATAQPAAAARPAAVAAATARPAAIATAATPVRTTTASGAGRTSVGGRHTPATAHIAQFRGAYNPDGPSMAPNCGPASVAMALRLVGLDVPGYSGQRSNDVLTKARIIATGRNDTRVGTTDTELERVVTAAGGRWSESSNLNQLLGWVQQGYPVILAGNPSGAWNKRFPSNQIYPYNGGHWVTVSGFNRSTGNYIVNDPLSQIGPIEVPPRELSQYMSRNGGLGIAVFK